MKNISYLTLLLSLLWVACGFQVSGTEVENEVKVSIRGTLTTTMALSNSPLELKSSTGEILAQTSTDTHGNFTFASRRIKYAQWVQISSPSTGINAWHRINSSDSIVQVPVDGISTAIAQIIPTDGFYQQRSDSLIRTWLGSGLSDSSWQVALGGSQKVRQLLSATLMKSWDGNQKIGEWLSAISKTSGGLLGTTLFQSNLSQTLTENQTTIEQGATILQKTTNTGTVQEWQDRLKTIDPTKDTTNTNLADSSLLLLERCIGFAQKSVFLRSGANLSNAQISQFKDSISAYIQPDLIIAERQKQFNTGTNWWNARCTVFGTLFGVLDTSEWNNPKWAPLWKAIEATEFGSYEKMIVNSDSASKNAITVSGQADTYWIKRIQSKDSTLLLWKNG